MKLAKVLNINGALLDNNQLKNYLEKIASEHILQRKTNKNTYPIPRLNENFKQITKTYDMLNLSLKLGIQIHPAGEWLLDNYYIIEETYKTIKKELPLKKYVNFIGISNGEYSGFARIYVLAAEIVAYTEAKIDGEKLKELLKAYQNKKTLDMKEIWNISIFLNIVLIEQIRNICEKIIFVQIQKYKVESIIERCIENKSDQNLIYKKNININNIGLPFSKEPFVEYLSYRLNQFGKRSLPFIKILEEQVEKTGTNISEIIRKEHFDIALKKLIIGNCIKSIKNIQRINFTQIFEQTNGVEELLKKDPAGIYKQMTYKTKEYYRNEINNLSLKTKISEIYITTKALELAEQNKKDVDERKSHIGYYIIDKGVIQLKESLNISNTKIKEINNNVKNAKRYTINIIILTSLITLIIGYSFFISTHKIVFSILFTIFIYIPISEIVIKIVQYILQKIIKPKIIPKLDFTEGIPKEFSTMVIVPTILNGKKDVKEILEKLEVYYLANKSPNIYFTLLGDCTTSSREVEMFDEEIIQEGKKEINKLNNKYKSEINIFNFIYRKRIWNGKESSFLGWERKRGIIAEFNNFLLGNKKNTFKYNSFEENIIPKIKYVITLDSDTNLVLDSAKELIGSMAHILNKPIINKNIVVEGYGIIQPRIEIDLNSSRKTLFTKIYAGMGGTDAYSNAISDVYQDNFGEGIFIGKGIYDLEVFNYVLKDAIPENTVLSHDLLEGIYARSGLATDIILLDSYPTKFNSYITRAKRWIRGDWQIITWLKDKVINKKGEIIDNPINEIGKLKILDNLRRSTLEICQLICLIILIILNNNNLIGFYLLLFVSIFIELVINFLNTIIFKKEGVKKQASFENKLPGLKLNIVRSIINFSAIIYKAQISLEAIIVTINRMFKTHEHLLEWVTSDEAEKNSKNTIQSFIKEMKLNIIIGGLILLMAISKINIFLFIISTIWISSPIICWYISKKINDNNPAEILNKEEKNEVLELARKTWNFFDDYLNEKNNFLPPDNYQENRKEKVVSVTSSTNIGLAMLSVISAYDLKFIELDKALYLLKKMLETISKLAKWNGHLYNWYNIKTLQPLKPEYISTVDSGNFIGYLIITKEFLKSIQDKERIEKYLLNSNIEYMEQLINNTNFFKLYNNDIGLLSIGYNIEENKLTDSYYDLLASEARQSSLIAIAKKDLPSKHWSNLSRTLTNIDNKKGLVSWSGTAFEYLMPNINIKKYKGSLLDESCKFAIMSQQKYCNKLQIPWGMSEAAFNLKDLNSNYQYKAFGIPWLGLKRGLANDIVVASYGSILAITDNPKEVIKNIKILKKYDMYNKYGLYESIDFTPERLRKNKKYEVVKTYMAHHQGLILLSINNLINNNILRKRFHNNPMIKTIDILLQEKMPEDFIITKDKKEKIEKIKYKGYNIYYERQLDTLKSNLPDINIISNENYTVCINEDGIGFSKYKNILINRYKNTNSYKEGIFFYFKNVKNKSIWTSYLQNNNYKIKYTLDMTQITSKSGNIETKIKTIVSPNDNVEIRNIKINNLGLNNEIIEITSILEPVLSEKNQDYAHKAFNNLFLKYEKIENGILIKRNKRGNNNEIFLAVGFFSNNGNIENLEYEIDKEKLYGRLNTEIPNKIKNSEKFSNNIGLVVDPIVSFRRTIKIEKKETVELNLIISVSEEQNKAIKNLDKYKNFETVNKTFEISKIRNEEAARYLQATSKDIIIYQKMLSYCLRLNPLKKLYINNFKSKEFKQQDLWRYGISGDNPIILVKIKEVNDIYVIKELLKAYQYFQSKNVILDLVILDEEKKMCEKYVKEAVIREIADLNLTYLINNKIFILSSEILENNKELLMFRANLIIDAAKGNLENIIFELEEEYLYKYKKNKIEKDFKKEENFEKYDINKLDLKYTNSYGGFSNDGREYIMSVDSNIPSTWCNVLTNKEFGSIVTQNLGGYTWYKNSRINRITKWSNDTIMDFSPERIYIQDINENKYWRLGEGNLLVTYGFGYSKYEQNKLDLKQELRVFVSSIDNVKISLLKLKNNTNNIKKINIIYVVENVLDEDEIKSNGNIELNYEKKLDLIYSKNLLLSDIKNLSYIYSSEHISSYTGNLENINIYKDMELTKEDSLGNKSCMAIKVEVEVKAFAEKEISLILGGALNERQIETKYKDINVCENEYNNTKKYWSNLIEKIRVRTPNEALNIILNGWDMYQVIASRLYAKSGFNQSGGAFGFRDQLQDVLGVKFLNTDMVKQQILKHAMHQFIEGDVEHWWHEETKKGIRTKFSDDRLWLVYLVLEYIKFTGDNDILNIKISYVNGKTLRKDEDESYDFHTQSEVEESIYMHCLRAIDISINFGKNNLPLIGSGDWNDGFSTVGNKGIGESVWLGFFMYDIINRFLEIVKQREEDVRIIKKYENVLAILKKSLNKNAWDGRWYKRAYMDNGKILGSSNNEECRIDSIAQSWAVISEAADNDKKYIAMESLEKYLVNKKEGIIKLLDPPFEKSNLEPGYIKAYLPGVRENGGQYTHAAVWAIIAFAKLKLEDKATKYLEMINPIEHANTKEKIDKYKIEPYVIPADIYGSSNLLRKRWLELVYGFC